MIAADADAIAAAACLLSATAVCGRREERIGYEGPRWLAHAMDAAARARPRPSVHLDGSEAE